MTPNCDRRHGVNHECTKWLTPSVALGNLNSFCRKWKFNALKDLIEINL